MGGAIGRSGELVGEDKMGDGKEEGLEKIVGAG